ncbi:hypothetical protein DFH28DRAFT_930011 [Melampsora americana]|nr:hypothetical protein DFH28DRAFT_930011 [Melampsora americana]
MICPPHHSQRIDRISIQPGLFGAPRMTHLLAPINIETEGMDLLTMLYSKFTQGAQHIPQFPEVTFMNSIISGIKSNLMLRFNDEESVEVELHHNLAYRFYKVDSNETFCRMWWLNYDVSNSKVEGGDFTEML